MKGSPILLSAQSRPSSLYCRPDTGPTTISTARRAADENTGLAMRKSCDFCYRHKKGCILIPDGVGRCRRCADKGEGHLCIFSPRKRKEKRGAPIKGPALSASSATGLLGTPENILLSNYFACVGFLPFANQRGDSRPNVTHKPPKILEAMTIIMIKRDPAPPDRAPGHKEGSGFDIVRTPNRSSCAMQDDEEGCSGEGGLCRGSLMCLFWSALAIGGLSKGQKIEAVSTYVSRAEAAVESIAGTMTIEHTRALNILAYMYGLAGENERYHDYSKKANDCLRAASRERSQNDVEVGFVELVQHRESVKRSTADLASDDIEELCNQDLNPPLKIGDFATEGEMYRFFMHTYKALEQAFYLDLSGHDQPTEGVNVPEKSKVEKKSRSVVLDRFQTCLREFERLEKAVDRPKIKKSVGGFLINCVLVFAKASKRDIEGALDRASLCIDFVERYPGFNRWMHTSHILASVLVTMSGEEPRARQLYETLRASYNPTKGNFPEMPPLEEWKDDSLECGNFYCRSMTWVMSSNEIPFSFAQRCHHAPAPEKIKKIEEGLDHHQNGYDHGCTTGIDNPPSPCFIHAAPPTVRAVSPTSSNGSNEHEAWSTERAMLYTTDLTGSNAAVVPNVLFDQRVHFNVKMTEKAPPSSLEATTRAPTPILFEEIDAMPFPPSVFISEKWALTPEETEAFSMNFDDENWAVFDAEVANF